MNATSAADAAVAADQADTLTASDRCDRCGARAVMRAVLPSGLDLLFCAHHLREYEDAIKAKDIKLTK